MREIKLENREAVDYLEALSVEMEARKDVIAFMLSRDMEIASEQFKAYHRELVEFKGKFETAKREFERTVVLPRTEGKRVDWSLDYASAVLTLTEVQA